MIDIKKEDFDKLPQLDRIEFRQQYFNLENKTEYDYTAFGMFSFMFFSLSLMFWMFALLSAPIYGDEFFRSMLFASLLIAKALGFYIGLNLIIIIVLKCRKNKEVKKLIAEYFRISTTKGAKK